jgi:hypothetical protein
MGFLSSVGGMIGSAVGGMFAGPMGAKIGGSLGAGLGGVVENLIGQHGQPNVQSAMNNNMLGSLVSQLSQAIQCAPGIPQFAKDELCQALQDVQHSCPQEPTPPGCQQDTDNSMSGLIDKIVDKVVDQIMQKLQGGGGCENGGSIQDMVRQAIEDVVREKFGGGEGGGCHADGATGGTSSANDSGKAGGSSADGAKGTQGNCNLMTSSEDDSKEAKKARSGNWLVALAQGMAEIASKHLDGMMKAQRTMEESSPDDASKLSDDQKQKNQNDFIRAQGEFQAESKLFTMATEAASNAVKSVGDGLASLARKQ